MVDHQKQTRVSDALDAYQAGLAVEGDARAFALLYKRWHPRLMRLALRLTRNPSDAQDVMQDAALTIARDIHKLRDSAHFPGWACTIVRRRAADHIGREVRQREGETDMPGRDADAASPEAALSLKQALERLPDTDRLMLKLFYLDGFRGREIAASLGIPLGTVKSRLHAARQALKTIYTEGDDHD